MRFDDAARRRIRWLTRRGLLELDIVLGRFMAQEFDSLSDDELAVLVQILDLPDGYNHDATQLSGGQQQRIAIARLFLKNPPIIFLDEPTASLDAIATEQIKHSLDQIKQGRTVIIISHSLSQIIDADYTYVMKEGTIAEHGEHDQLYHQQGVYKEIFDAMAKSLNIEKIAKTFEDDAEEETHS